MLIDPFGRRGLLGVSLLTFTAGVDLSSSSGVKVSQKVLPWILSISDIIPASTLSLGGINEVLLTRLISSRSGRVNLSIEGVWMGIEALLRGSLVYPLTGSSGMSGGVVLVDSSLTCLRSFL